MKNWTDNEIRALARKTVDGRRSLNEARGDYLRALVESAQYELSEQPELKQMAALRVVNKRFYPIVQAAVIPAGIRRDKQLPKAVQQRNTDERNRLTNFARTSYHAIRSWLKAPGHDLMKLDAAKVKKSQLLNEAPPPKKHMLTAERVQTRAHKLFGQFVDFTQQVGKMDKTQAVLALRDAKERIEKLLSKVSTGYRTPRRSGDGERPSA